MPTSDRLLLAAGVLLLAGCSAPSEAPSGAPAGSRAPAEPRPSAQATVGAEPVEEAALHSDGTPRGAMLTIPSIRVRGLAVVPYVGWTDDAPGTRIQNRGRAASPHGPRGGVGPGGIGNYQVTAHRLSSTRAFEQLPSLRRGDVVHVAAGGVRYTYRIVGTRETSFRLPGSLRAQRAAVPGRPGVTPTRAMITLSTCATLEDHAAGNWWADRFGNPEHRIDKIGVLVTSTPV
ncbi:sortase [Nocardioides sp. YIM 152315]|uniref:sortase domain-containing protein n=1 Tax=Nocardioides sp. YIM 152315 TaxID=3031760 RepID=UPI0023D9E0AD|nr:sortase [Nocardioides sp. YIM 152315]MDF1602499.1 sortase [Nocardioides sp. YIM 152315]